MNKPNQPTSRPSVSPGEQTGHTPTPWKLVQRHPDDTTRRNYGEILTAEGWGAKGEGYSTAIAEIHLLTDPLVAANADFILTACNSYHGLIAENARAHEEATSLNAAYQQLAKDHGILMDERDGLVRRVEGLEAQLNALINAGDTIAAHFDPGPIPTESPRQIDWDFGNWEYFRNQAKSLLASPAPGIGAEGSTQPKRRRMTCQSCFGSGRIDDHVEPVRRCDDCVGLGYYFAKPAALTPPQPGDEQ